MSDVSIDAARCSACGICASACPSGVLMAGGGAAPPTVRPDAQCILCGHCVAVCPSDAVEHASVLTEAVGHGARLPVEHALEFLRGRRSLRRFEAREVERDVLESILRAASWAPSAKNLQSTQYVVIRDRELLRSLSGATVEYLRGVTRQLGSPLRRALLRRIAGPQVDGVVPMLPALVQLCEAWDAGRDPVLFEAPCLIVFTAHVSATFGLESAQLALHNAALAAHAHGLAGFYTGYLTTAAARAPHIGRLLGLAPDQRVCGGFALGYPAYGFRRHPVRREPTVTWR